MDMLLFFKFVTIAYFLGINVYGFILVYIQKRKDQSINITKRIDTILLKQEQEKNNQSSHDNQSNLIDKNKKDITKTKKNIRDGKLFLTGALGGAIGVYVAMFVYKYKLTSFLLMVIMPVFIAINLYCLLIAFSGSFWVTPQ